MKLPQLRYQCDNCGLCCNSTLIGCNDSDRQREPLLQTLPKINSPTRPELHGKYLMNKAPDDPTGIGCRFHSGTACGIYATRPGVCVSFEAGNPDCQYLRKSAGLPELVPVMVDVEQVHTVELTMIDSATNDR